jgi:hypothetical protein
VNPAGEASGGSGRLDNVSHRRVGRLPGRLLFIKQARADDPTVESVVWLEPGRSPWEGKDAAFG